MLVRLKDTNQKTVIFSVFDDIAKKRALYPCSMHKKTKDGYILVVQMTNGVFVSYRITVKGKNAVYTRHERG